MEHGISVPLPTPQNLVWRAQNAKSCSEQQQAISFLDLPAEIRNRIYMLSLNFGSIELAAKRPGCGLHTIKGRMHQYKMWQREVRPALSLLRVSKQINVEAAGIFLRRERVLLHGQMWPRHLARVLQDHRQGEYSLPRENHRARPVRAVDYILDRPANTSKTCQRNFNEWAARKGLHQQSSSRFPVARTIAGKHGSLREYKMIVPWDLDIIDARFASNLRSLYWHVQSKAGRADGRGDGGVKTSLVIFDWDDEVYPYYDWIEWKPKPTRLECVAFARRAGWELLEGATDEVGVYEYRSWQDKRISEAGQG